MNKTRSGLAVVALLFGVVLSASAQTHTIRIEDGVVYVDGRVQEASELPETLKLEGLSANLTFSGATRFQFGDRVYSLTGGRLTEVDPEGNEMVVFVNRMANAPLFEVASHEKAFGNTIGVYYDLLEDHVNTLDALHAEFDREQTGPVADRMRQKAEQTALMVRAFPRVEFQTYLEDVQDRNVGLYDRILREQLMEVETRRLASRIRTTADKDRQAELRDQLRDRLEEIFELKQGNRLAEIDHLETRLTELRTQMDARETYRDDIIERRIRELLGELD